MMLSAPPAHMRVDRYWQATTKHYRGMNQDKPNEQRIRELVAYYAHRCPVCGVKRCREHRAKVRTGASIPYGYELVDDVAEIDHEVAEEIRTIFRLYVELKGSQVKILPELKARGILSPRGAGWHRSSLMQIITDSTYGGHRSKYPQMVNRALAREARKLAKIDKRKQNGQPKKG